MCVDIGFHVEAESSIPVITTDCFFVFVPFIFTLLLSDFPILNILMIYFFVFVTVMINIVIVIIIIAVVVYSELRGRHDV